MTVQIDLTEGGLAVEDAVAIVLAHTARDRLAFVYDDGGRAAAGYKGSAGDCVVRAFCILTGADYAEAYREFAYAQSVLGEEKRRRRSARNGIDNRPMANVFERHGLRRIKLGRGVKPTWAEAHERYGDCIVRTRGHVSAIVAGVVRDTHDERGYWWSEYHQMSFGGDHGNPPAEVDDLEWRERKAMSVWVAA